MSSSESSESDREKVKKARKKRITAKKRESIGRDHTRRFVTRVASRMSRASKATTSKKDQRAIRAATQLQKELEELSPVHSAAASSCSSSVSSLVDSPIQQSLIEPIMQPSTQSFLQPQPQRQAFQFQAQIPMQVPMQMQTQTEIQLPVQVQGETKAMTSAQLQQIIEGMVAKTNADMNRELLQGNREMLEKMGKMEQKMTKLELTVNEVVDKAMVKCVESLRKEWQEDFSQLGQEVQEKLEQVGEDFSGVENRQSMIETRIEELELKYQAREMDYAIRIRGLQENQREDLVMDLVMAWGAVGENAGVLKHEIDRAYRVNSWYALQKKLPRDVVIYFTKKTTRNTILEVFYRTRFKIANQDVIILKELPGQYLKRKKDFAILVAELNKNNIRFRWDLPSGLVVRFQGKVYRIDDTLKAKELLDKLKNEFSKTEGMTLRDREKMKGHPMAQKASGSESVGGARSKDTPLLVVKDLPGFSKDQNG